MMKKYFYLIVFIFQGFMSYAQISSYTFSQSNSTYVSITGGSLLGTATNDEEFFTDSTNLAGGTTANGGSGFPIGFNFTYNGVVFDRIGINTNGWISLGQSSSSPAVNMGATAGSNVYTPISSTSTTTPTQLRNRISALGGDLQGQAGASLRVQTIGTAPSRTLVVQWTNYKRFGTSGTGDTLTFQIRLVETTNEINIVYDSLNYTSNASNSFQVGLGGQTNAEFNNRATASINGNWNMSTAGAQNNDVCYINSGAITPTSGLTYTWGLTTNCSGTPSSGTVSPSLVNVCPGSNPGILNVLGISNYIAGLTFQWEQSLNNFATAGVNAVGGSGNTTTSYTPPAFSGTDIYYRLKITCANSGLSSYSASIPVKSSAINPSLQASSVAITAFSTSATINWINGNGSRRIVVISTTPLVAPVNNIGPALNVNNTYTGAGQQIIYDGTANTVNVFGLNTNIYYVGVFEYNICPNAGQFDYFYNSAIVTNNTKSFATTITNDSCFVSAGLNPAGSFGEGAVVGSFFGANISSIPPSTCATNSFYDVWYTTAVPLSGNLTIETQINSINSTSDTVLAVYTSCGGVLLGCDDNSGLTGVNDNMSIITITGRTPGEILYIGVWKKGASAATLSDALFKIAVYDASLANQDFEFNNLKIYPNPFNTDFKITLEEKAEGTIVDFTGKTIRNLTLHSGENFVNLSEQSQGIYFVKLHNENGNKIFKLVKE
jgi:Secretion system C-terminal sorting domain